MVATRVGTNLWQLDLELWLPGVAGRGNAWGDQLTGNASAWTLRAVGLGGLVSVLARVGSGENGESASPLDEQSQAVERGGSRMDQGGGWEQTSREDPWGG
jgi:hypothetical protein